MKTDDKSLPPSPLESTRKDNPAAPDGDGKPPPLTTESDLPPDHGKAQELQIEPLPKIDPAAGEIPPEPDHDHDPEKPRPASGTRGKA